MPKNRAECATGYSYLTTIMLAGKLRWKIFLRRRKLVSIIMVLEVVWETPIRSVSSVYRRVLTLALQLGIAKIV